MITGEVSTRAAAFDAEFLREAYAFVAAGASGARKIFRGDGGVGIEMRLDGVNAVAIGADRCERIALTDGLAVNALHELGFDRLVALGAGGGNVEFENGGFVVAGAADFMHSVAIGTDGSLGGSIGDSAAVHAFFVGVKLLRALADAFHDDLLAVTVAAGGGNVVVMNR